MIIQKSNKIVLVSHCILNQNSVVDGLQRSPGALQLARLLIDSGIGILQLPCPEFFMMNLDRPGMTYAEYDRPEFRLLAHELIQPVVWQVEQYRRFGYEVVGLIGIEDSPNCSISGQTGLFMELLLDALTRKGIVLRTLEVPPAYGSDPVQDEILNQTLIKFLEN